MDLQDRFYEWLLAAIDRLMDWLSSGRWSEIRGEMRFEFKVKEQ